MPVLVTDWELLAVDTVCESELVRAPGVNGETVALVEEVPIPKLEADTEARHRQKVIAPSKTAIS